jgi:hypothetical protein
MSDDAERKRERERERERETQTWLRCIFSEAKKDSFASKTEEAKRFSLQFSKEFGTKKASDELESGEMERFSTRQQI